MAQHYLLSAKARTLSVASVARMTEDQAVTTFRALRWASTDGAPVCPDCGSLSVYGYASRPIFKCKDCRKQFSVTSGTIFANRKLPLREYLLAVALFVNGAKGVSALQLGRDLDVQYKTAFVLAHKLREAMASEEHGRRLSGNVEIDGAYFGGHVKPENRKEDRVDARLAENQTGKRKVVVVMRERGGRTLPAVFKSEGDAIPMIRERTLPGSTIHADESSAWDRLHAFYGAKRINHRVAFSDDGACTNQAESYFSRLRRAEIGTHHCISVHLGAYASEMAWREDHRRISNGAQFTLTTTLAARHPQSRKWSGYWQRTA